MMTLAVTGALDSHRDHVFLASPDGQRGPNCPDVLFVGFRTDFVTYVRVSVASAGVLTLAGLRQAGPENPKGGAPLPPHPLATSLQRIPEKDNCEQEPVDDQHAVSEETRDPRRFFDQEEVQCCGSSRSTVNRGELIWNSRFS